MFSLIKFNRRILIMEIVENTQVKPSNDSVQNSVQKYYLDGKETTLVEIEQARRKPNVKIILTEGTTNQYKTLQKLYD